MKLRFVVVTKKPCPHCDRVLKKLSDENVDHDVVEIGKDIERSRFLELCPDAKHVPYVIKPLASDDVQTVETMLKTGVKLSEQQMESVIKQYKEIGEKYGH